MKMLLMLLLLFSYTSCQKSRLSLAQWGSYNYRDHKGPGTYAFGYDIEDDQTSNTQFRQEERHANGTVTGSYGFVDGHGNVHTVHYIADHRGFRILKDENPLPSNNQPYQDMNDVADEDLRPIQFPHRFQTTTSKYQDSNYLVAPVRRPIPVPLIFNDVSEKSPWKYFKFNSKENKAVLDN